jgi:peptidoglycan biosynthesis protein MviN/MurJ (putative lipid II flippase)
MLVSFVAVGLNLLFNWLFTFHFGWGHKGLAFSTGLVASSNFLFLYMMMSAQLKGLHTGEFLKLLSKLAVGSAAIVLVCLASNRWLLADWPTQSLTLKVGALLLTIGVSAVAYALACMLLKVREFEEAFAAIKRRLRR